MESACDGADEGPREHSRFLIARQGAEDADVLVLGLPDGQTALPGFGLEEEAGMFLWLETAREGWRVVEISEADLAALLRESCAGVRRVVHPFAAEVTGKGPVSVDREDFLRALSGERSRQGEGAGRNKPPRVSAGKGKRFLVRSTCPRRFWLIARHRTGGMEVLRITIACGEEALPVFSFEDEAKMFLKLGVLDGWRVRVTTAGELTSVLFGPCAGVRRVALDPLPGQDAAALVGPVSMERRVFMESLLEKRGDLTVGHGHEHSRRQGDVIARRVTLKRR